ncbi:MAG TPA: hypothetical protein VMV08_00975 [Gaiellaceae bacterium]|nr:hypothetical protein [Gaiellaceae bacterium]
MSRGLTFGTITSLYGLNAHIIDRTQFSLLIAVVVLSAIVPTAIAQRYYSPSAGEQRDLTAPIPLARAPPGSATAEPKAQTAVCPRPSPGGRIECGGWDSNPQAP